MPTNVKVRGNTQKSTSTTAWQRMTCLLSQRELPPTAGTERSQVFFACVRHFLLKWLITMSQWQSNSLILLTSLGFQYSAGIAKEGLLVKVVQNLWQRCALSRLPREVHLGTWKNSYIATQAKPQFTLRAIGSFVETAMVFKRATDTLQLNTRNAGLSRRKVCPPLHSTQLQTDYKHEILSKWLMWRYRSTLSVKVVSLWCCSLQSLVRSTWYPLRRVVVSNHLFIVLFEAEISAKVPLFAFSNSRAETNNQQKTNQHFAASQCAKVRVCTLVRYSDIL